MTPLRADLVGEDVVYEGFPDVLLVDQVLPQLLRLLGHLVVSPEEWQREVCCHELAVNNSTLHSHSPLPLLVFLLFLLPVILFSLFLYSPSSSHNAHTLHTEKSDTHMHSTPPLYPPPMQPCTHTHTHTHTHTYTHTRTHARMHAHTHARVHILERRVLWLENKLVFHESGAHSKHWGLLLLIIKKIIGSCPQGIQSAGEDRFPFIHHFQCRIKDGGSSHQLCTSK